MDIHVSGYPTIYPDTTSLHVLDSRRIIRAHNLNFQENPGNLLKYFFTLTFYAALKVF
jgi:hypothetical protein